jgi:hypothetical protein
MISSSWFPLNLSNFLFWKREFWIPLQDPNVKVRCAFITEYAVVDRIIDHLKLTFVAPKPPPSHIFEQVTLMAAHLMITGSGSLSSFSLWERVFRPNMLFGRRISR